MRAAIAVIGGVVGAVAASAVGIMAAILDGIGLSAEAEEARALLDAEA